ncbi:SulP family inorganic anion transporter [Aureispira anguillae]|uniref:Sulfate permease n=1 Tax=Aureispira anguillae TaxID=2864201 RepID=A0A915YMJ0_9BACT|nr:sulfate permease [Aureispira anguillae]BDS15558.1 sulfate permease [Aureispira anguillae]
MNIKSILPILDWLPNYNKQHLKGDVNAGLTVGIMLIPQGMAYAMLAGLPPIYGLYAAIVPQLIYAIFGTSRQLGVGPVAMDSLLVAVSVSQFAQINSDHYITLAILLAFMVGSIQLILGILRLGVLVNFLSHPVISGFTSAAALIIGVSQLKYLMGVDLERSQFLHVILWDAWQQLLNINPYTLFIGISGILIILLSKKIMPTIPAPLIVVISGILAVWGLGLDQYGVAIVKEIPKGLPSPQLPLLDGEVMQQLFSSAITIALVAFMEAIAVAKAIHARHNDYKIEPNQELIALGLSNMIGSFFQSFPGTGGFSRSAVNDQAGAKTNLAAIISALFMVVTLLFLTPLFYYLPKAVLASIIMVAVFKLISIQDPLNLWKKGHKRDLAILIITFIATLSIGIQKGILVGVLLSIIGTLYDSLYPKVRVQFSDWDLPDYAFAVRFEGALYFGNSNYFKDKMEAILSQLVSNQDSQPIEYVLLDGSHIHQLDSTGEKALEYILQVYENKGIPILLVALPFQLSKPIFSSVQAAISSKKDKKMSKNTPYVI